MDTHLIRHTPHARTTNARGERLWRACEALPNTEYRTDDHNCNKSSVLANVQHIPVLHARLGDLPVCAVQVQDARLHRKLTIEPRLVEDAHDPARGVGAQDAVAELYHAAARGAARVGQSKRRWARRAAGSDFRALRARPDGPVARALASLYALHGAGRLQLFTCARARRAALVPDLTARARVQGDRVGRRLHRSMQGGLKSGARARRGLLFRYERFQSCSSER